MYELRVQSRYTIPDDLLHDYMAKIEDAKVWLENELINRGVKPSFVSRAVFDSDLDLLNKKETFHVQPPRRNPAARADNFSRRGKDEDGN